MQQPWKWLNSELNRRLIICTRFLFGWLWNITACTTIHYWECACLQIGKPEHVALTVEPPLQLVLPWETEAVVSCTIHDYRFHAYNIMWPLLYLIQDLLWRSHAYLCAVWYIIQGFFLRGLSLNTSGRVHRTFNIWLEIKFKLRNLVFTEVTNPKV